jgi:hypothetical protein
LPNETYRTVVEQLARTKSSSLTVFADFCRVAACALAMGSREVEYLDVARSYTRDELSDLSRAMALLVQEMETKPFTDILGEYYLSIAANSSKHARGEFFTPPEISKLIAMMLVDVDAVKAAGKPITMNEPACGSGGMILTMAEQFAPTSIDLLRVTAQDINPVAVDMCYINLTLWGIPAKVILGDTLRNTRTAEWRNLHWHRVGEEQRLMIGQFQELMTSEPEPIPATSFAEKVKTSEVNGQFQFDL